MPSLSATLSFSQVFDYETYKHDTRDGGEDHDEKLPVLEDADAAAFWDLDQPLGVSPLHDVQNLVTHDEVAPAPNSAERPASALHDLFHQQENVPSALIRRESTHLVLDVSPPTVGPSRTASQDRTWRALVRMTSSFGSEFGGSDAVIYGGSDRGEGSVLSEDEETPEDDDEGQDPEFFEERCAEDVVMHYDTDNSLSDEEASEHFEDGNEMERDASSDEGGNYDEVTQEAPQDVPPPLSPEDFAPTLRRSARVRQLVQRSELPSSPKKDKGKGKAVARNAHSPAPPKRTSTKRPRSPSPSPSPSDSGDKPDAPSGSTIPTPKHPRLTNAETQEMAVIPEDAITEFQCAVAGCEHRCSLHNIAGLSRHFGKHYFPAERKAGVKVRCRWGKCNTRDQYALVVRHLKEDHLGLRWRCEHCGNTYVRADLVKRHQDDTSCGKEPGPSSKKGEGSSRKGKGRRK